MASPPINIPQNFRPLREEVVADSLCDTMILKGHLRNCFGTLHVNRRYGAECTTTGRETVSRNITSGKPTWLACFLLNVFLVQFQNCSLSFSLLFQWLQLLPV